MIQAPEDNRTGQGAADPVAEPPEEHGPGRRAKKSQGHDQIPGISGLSCSIQ